ncbi:hypothetical protein Tco_1187930 [Tanacetum coccineum]
MFRQCSSMDLGTPVKSASFQANTSKLLLSGSLGFPATILHSASIVVLLWSVTIPLSTRILSIPELVECSPSPKDTINDICPNGQDISLLNPKRGVVAGVIRLLNFRQSLLKQCSYNLFNTDPPSTYMRWMRWPSTFASTTIGFSCLSLLSSSLIKCDNCSDLNASSICFCPDMGGGALNFTVSIAKISFRVFIRGVNLSYLLPDLCWFLKCGLLSKLGLWLVSWCLYADGDFFLDWFTTVTSPLRKVVVTLIISSTDLGMLSFSLLINSRLVMPCMNLDILMHSGASFTCMLSALKPSMKAFVDYPSFCLMW